MNIVVASHSFAPFNRVGAKRMTAFAAYLVREGHEVTVVKAHNKYYGCNIDESIHADGVDTIAVEVKSAITPLAYYEWVYRYYDAIRRLSDDKKQDCLIISGGPFNYYLTGALLKRFRHIPYVLDMRDFQSPDACGDISRGAGKSLARRFLSAIKWKLDILLERISVSGADACTVPSEGCLKRCHERYPRLKDKFHIVRNGYEEGMCLGGGESQAQRARSRTMSIFIMGKFSQYDADFALQLKEALLRAHDDLGLGFRIVQLDETDTAMGEAFADAPFVDYEACCPMGYAEALDKGRKFDLLMTSAPGYSTCGTKIYDYMLIDRPVISLCREDSDLAYLTLPFEGGFVCSNATAIREAVMKIYKEGIALLNGGGIDIARYARNAQFKVMTDLIEGARQ